MEAAKHWFNHLQEFLVIMSATTSFASFLSLCVALATAGCSFELGDSSDGDRDRANFRYLDVDDDCFFGCSLDEHVMVGARQLIAVDGAGEAAVRVTSSNPDVATFDLERRCDGQGRCDTDIHMDAVGDGNAKLQLRSESGRVIDSVTVRVRDAESVSFEGFVGGDDSTTTRGDTFEVRVGQTLHIVGTYLDGSGDQLLSTDAVTWRFADETVAGFPLLFSFEETHHWETLANDDVTLEGIAPGETTLHVDGGGIQREIRIIVTE